jgi:membrane-bound lytic murein transglycosylase A
MKSKFFVICIQTIVISFLAFSITGCGLFRKAPPLPLKRVSVKKLPVFSDDMMFEGLENSINQSLSYLNKLPSNRMFNFGEDAYDAAHMIKSLEHFLNFLQQNPTQEVINDFIRSNYLVYKSIGSDKKGKVLFTGYYEPFLKGSLEPSNEYRIPVYTLPKDRLVIDISMFSDRFKQERPLVGRLGNGRKVIPYYDRKELDESNILKNRSKVLAWVNDKVDLFFLGIQGSGVIMLDNGDKMNVHYHGSNGHPYRSIGKLLKDEGKLPEDGVSMQSIKQYLKSHPDEIQEILNHNPSYVFFLKEEGGPFGCLSVELTPGRSLALERRIFPSAALAFIETQKPVVDDNGQIQTWIDFSRFIMNQDTGGAIKGPGRADIFWGNGEYAKIAAGHLQHEGKLSFLILKPEIEAR